MNLVIYNLAITFFMKNSVELIDEIGTYFIMYGYLKVYTSLEMLKNLPVPAPPKYYCIFKHNLFQSHDIIAFSSLEHLKEYMTPHFN